MPCCKLCNSIQTASIIGRIIVALSAVGIILGFLRMVITLITGAIFQAVVAGILIFGAQHRNRTALLFWMFVTILELIVSTTFLALVLIVLIYPEFLSFNREETLENNINNDDQKDVEVHKVYDDFFKLTFGITMEQFQYIVIRHNNMIVPLIAATFGWICFKLWGLNVARKARKEILYSESLPATYQRGHGSNHEMAMGITNVSGANRGYKGPGQKGYLDQRGQHLPPAYTPHLPEHYLKVDSGHNHPGYY